jgi:hypothetical protein
MDGLDGEVSAAVQANAPQVPLEDVVGISFHSQIVPCRTSPCSQLRVITVEIGV